MKSYTDLHVHSHYFCATNKSPNLEYINLWSQLKGIDAIGIGEFMHSAWFTEIQEKLEPAEEGLFQLKNNIGMSPEMNFPRRLSEFRK